MGRWFVWCLALHVALRRSCNFSRPWIGTFVVLFHSRHTWFRFNKVICKQKKEKLKLLVKYEHFKIMFSLKVIEARHLLLLFTIQLFHFQTAKAFNDKTFSVMVEKQQQVTAACKWIPQYVNFCLLVLKTLDFCYVTIYIGNIR